MTSRILAAAGAALVTGLVATAFLWAASLPVPLAPSEDTFSFEQDMEGWAAGGADLFWGNCTGEFAALRPSWVTAGNCSMAWSVERTTERAKDGEASVKLFLDNLQDQGKIWIERAFNVTPGRSYRVHLAFAFASADYGSVNHWTILAGALPEHPVSSANLTPVIRGDTGNGRDSGSGCVWLDKAYDSIVGSPDDRLWVVVGVWGTWETPRTYYVDAVTVTIRPA